MTADPVKPPPKPKVIIERVAVGRFLVDCSACGTVGVWPERWRAVLVKGDHVCGEPPTIPGKIGTTFVVGGRLTGQADL